MPLRGRRDSLIETACGSFSADNNRFALPSGVHIQDRSGNLLSTVSLSNFWGSLGPFTTNVGTNVYVELFDPRVLYDPYQDRFIFAILADSGNRPATSSLYLGVSQTGDPTGNWNLYGFDVDATNQRQIDFPFMGLNKDWIVVRGFMLPTSGDYRVDLFVFNKTNFYAGGAGLYTRFQTGFDQLQTSLKPHFPGLNKRKLNSGNLAALSRKDR